MRLWLARNSDVPLREQLVAQVVLAILSGEAAVGQRLPSTRELAQRLKLHPNTVSAAYTELEREGWVESRRGSGVYVRNRKRQQPLSPEQALDQVIANFFRTAREQGASLKQLRARLRHWLALQPPDHFLLIEPDEELRRIVITELEAKISFPVVGAGEEVCCRTDAIAGAIPLVLPSKLERVRANLPSGTECIGLQVRSVPSTLSRWTPIPPDALIIVASRWQDFLKWARTMLLAAGADSDAMEFRDARRSGWKDGLREATVIISDVVTARELPRGCRSIVFPVVADASLDALHELATSK